MFCNSKYTMSDLMLMIWFGFFRLILTFLHFAYSGYQYFDLAWSYLKRKLDIFQSRVLDTRLYVSQIVAKLDKCPSHLAVIVGTEGIRFNDFSNLVTWCLAAKISFVSFYDYTGNLKANENIYYKHLINNSKIDPKSLIFNLEKQTSKNGVLHETHLNIISLEDGKPLLVQVAKSLANKVVFKDLEVKMINEKLVNEEIYKINKIPEPDMGVICGTIVSTFGFLPWHIRLTEFLQVKNLNGIKVWEFTSLLRNYSSCMQRFGK